MGSHAPAVSGWLNAMKSKQGQEEFLQYHIEHAIALAKQIGSEELNEADVQLVRLLRNCVPLGEEAVAAILGGGVVSSIVRALSTQFKKATPYPARTACDLTPITAPSPDGDSLRTSFLAACAQLLANLTSSGALGAEVVWSHCFPDTLQHLIAHPSGPVHQAATLALYGCCRQGVRRSQALCAADGAVLTDAAAAHTDAAEHTAAVGSDEEAECAGGGGNGGPAAAASAKPGQDGACSGQCGKSSADATAAEAGRDGADALSAGVPASTSAGGSAASESGGTSADSAAAAAIVRPIWESLLRRLTVSEPRPAGQGGGGPDWTALLCSCVALRQGLLRPLMDLLTPAPPLHTAAAGGDAGGLAARSGPGAVAAAEHDASRAVASAAAFASTSSASTSASASTSVETVAGGEMCRMPEAALAPVAPRFGSLHPVLLHVLAHELYELQGGGAVDIGEWAAEATGGAGERYCGGRTASAASAAASAPAVALVEGRGRAAPAAAALSTLPPAARPVAAALLKAVEVVEAAARILAASEVGSGSPGGRSGGDGAGAAVSGPVAACGDADDRDLTAAVLEAGLELLKAAMQREDGGRALSGGFDLADWLLCEGGLLPRLLGMLAALQPAATQRANRRRRSAASAAASAAAASAAASAVTAATATACGPDDARPSAPDSDRPVVELPYELKALAAGFPGAAAADADVPPPYTGYRGDLVSVLANGAFRRPRVVSALLAGGGLELLLSQTHLDEHSPLSREWALWGVRNMCEMSDTVQARIAGLKLQTAVETPELRQLGMKLELDKGTGKLKVAKTEEAMALTHAERPRPRDP